VWCGRRLPFGIVDRELCGTIVVANSGSEVTGWRIVVSPELFADFEQVRSSVFEYIDISCQVTQCVVYA